MKFDQKNRTFVKKLIPLGVFFLFIFITNCDIFKSFKQNIYLADPTIFKDDCIYYLYGTTAGGVDSTNNGIKVYLSNDLVKWEYKGYALKKGNAFGDKGLAPQILREIIYIICFIQQTKNWYCVFCDLLVHLKKKIETILKQSIDKLIHSFSLTTINFTCIM